MGDKLQISTILEFVDAGKSSKCFREAEAIIDAKRIIMCGIKECKGDEIEIVGSCLQTSQTKANPHFISGLLVKENKKLKIKKISCSCKAGSSESCKHCVAVMLFCHEKDTKEWVIVEVQGDLESNTGGSVAGKTFGQLFFVKDKPILIIGYSILYGKIMDNNPNIAVLQKHKHSSEKTSVSSSSEKRTSYSLLALVKKRIVFRSRPKPIVTSESTTC